MSIPALTTADKVHTRISTTGVRLRTDHGDPLAIMAEVIEQASCDVAPYLTRYPLASLPDSDVVSNWTADVALYHLCRLRANPVPVSVMKRYEEVMEKLEKVQEGKLLVPDLSNAAGAPALRNYEIKYDQYPSKRVVSGRSTPRSNTGYPTYPDRREPPTY